MRDKFSMNQVFPNSAFKIFNPVRGIYEKRTHIQAKIFFMKMSENSVVVLLSIQKMILKMIFLETGFIKK